jgi:hypothetical protein
MQAAQPEDLPANAAYEEGEPQKPLMPSLSD